MTFGIVLKMRTVKHKHIIKKILCKAIDENSIEQKLKEIHEVGMIIIINYMFHETFTNKLNAHSFSVGIRQV